MTYIDPDLIADETAVAEAVLTAIADRLSAALDLPEGEEWEPAEGSPETSVGEAVGIVLASALGIVQEQERDDFAGFGEIILNEPRLSAEPAEATSRWTFDTLGTYLVPDGSELVLDAADGTPVAFATVGDMEFTGLFVDIPVVALEPGTIGNNLTGLARDYESLPHLTSVELTTASADGTDEQTRDEYIDLIARKAHRMKIVPVLTDDYADTAVDNPAVGSAVAVRLLDLDNPTDPPNSPGHVTLYLRAPDGSNTSGAVKAEVIASMQGEDRPLAVNVHAGDPTRTNVTISVDIRLAPGADEATTVAAVQAAIDEAYNPATYGYDQDAPGRWRVPRTTAERTINAFDVTGVIDDLDGVAKIEGVTINGGASVALNGWAPLPNLTAPATVNVIA